MFLAVFILYYVRKWCDITRWHGPSDAVYASHRTDNELDLKRGLGSTFAALVSLCGGAPVGQYGPLVNFGASIASFFSQITRVKLITPEILMSCGVAAAISAGFPALFISGFIFGAIALIYMKMIFAFSSIPAKYKLGYLPFALLAAAVTGIFGVFFPEILGLGVDIIFSFITEDFSLALIVILLGLKIFLTSLCIGFGIFGGVFSPALFIGAASGQFMSNLLSQMSLFAPSTVLAISGMAAVAACVVGAPLAVIMIILELTMSYEYAIAALVSTMVAVMVTNNFYGHSFFDKQLEQRGIDLSQGRGNLELMEKQVSSILTQDYLSVAPKETIGTIISKMSRNDYSEAYCLNPDGRFLGKCKLSEIVHVKKRDYAKDHLESNSKSIKFDASIMQAIEVASDFVGESIPVISRSDGKLAGVVTEADIFQAYMSTQVRINDLERS